MVNPVGIIHGAQAVRLKLTVSTGCKTNIELVEMKKKKCRVGLVYILDS